MSFVRAGLALSASTATRLVAGLFIVKVIALLVGAGGFGQLGQFMSLVNIITVLAGGGICTGLIKYVAQFRDNRSVLTHYLSSASLITLLSSLLLALFLVFFAGVVSRTLTGTSEYAGVIRALAAVQGLMGINNFVVGVINGNEDAQGFAISTVAGTVVGAALLYGATILWGLRGAMYGLMIMPAAVALFSVPYAVGRKMIPAAGVVPRFNREITGKLLQYSGMLCVTVSTLPVAQIVIRNMIEQHSGWVAVGYWQGVTKISDSYLSFVTVVLGTYYLPRLSSKVTKKELQSEVYRALSIAVPVTAVMSTIVYLLRDFIIHALFSHQFLPMRDFFFFQMIGDCLKVCAYTIVYVGIAKAMTKVCILAEIFQAGLFLVLSAVLLKAAGPVGVTYAYAVNYGLYFTVSLFMFTRYIKSDVPLTEKSRE